MKKRPGRPPGRRSAPGAHSLTVRIRTTTHDAVKAARPGGVGALIEDLLTTWLARPHAWSGRRGPGRPPAKAKTAPEVRTLTVHVGGRTHAAVKRALKERGRPREMGALIDALLAKWLARRTGVRPKPQERARAREGRRP